MVCPYLRMAIGFATQQTSKLAAIEFGDRRFRGLCADESRCGLDYSAVQVVTYVYLTTSIALIVPSRGSDDTFVG